MSVLDTIKERGNIRRYLSKPVPRDSLLKIIEAARLAQSAANRQPWQFILASNDETKKKLAAAARNQDLVRGGATVMVCLVNPGESAKVGPFEGFLIDLAIAVENMALTAWISASAVAGLVPSTRAP